MGYEPYNPSCVSLLQFTAPIHPLVPISLAVPHLSLSSLEGGAGEEGGGRGHHGEEEEAAHHLENSLRLCRLGFSWRDSAKCVRHRHIIQSLCLRLR